MTNADSKVQMNLKFKITTKGIRVDSEDNKCETAVKVICKNGQRHQVTVSGTELSEVCSHVKSSLPASTKKRCPETSLFGPKGKVRRMDRTVKLHCGNILKELMKHRSGWIFSEPVDPVKLSIPDYFSIISKPMDLGTIKDKLDGNMYSSIEEFAADVRLTFSNAMLYNHHGHTVHECAKILNGTFNKKWKSLEEKLKVQRMSTANDNYQDSRQSAGKRFQYTKNVDLGNNRPMLLEGQSVPMSYEEKLKLKSEVLNGKMTEKLCTVLQKYGLNGLKEEKLQSYIDATDDEILRKLRKEINMSFDAREGQANPVKMVKHGSNFLGQNLQKGTENCGCSFTSTNGRKIDSTAAKCVLCGSLICHCWEKNAPVQAFSDLSSGISSEHGHYGDSKTDTTAKCPSSFATSQSGPDSDGPGVVVNGSPHHSTPSATAASGQGWTTFDIQLSPKKALRVAQLKSRFASTIFKATHQGGKSDPITMQQERERLEREQLEESARIEREIKAAETAMRMKAQTELKKQREREREAARMALQKIERTVEIYENQEIWKDLEMLCCSPDAVNPLEQLLGLHRKDDDYVEEDNEDAVLDGEEGEILS